MLPFLASGQAIDNTFSFKNINEDKYFRLNYENDFFSATDIYYTQGIHLELVTPRIKHFPLSKILVHPHFSSVKYGIGVEHDGYTPTSISSDTILYGDRPFAACLFLKTFLIATDTGKKQRISTSLSTGVIGQAAGGREMQVGIHRWLHDITPHGWTNQIHNDAIFDYQVDYERQILSYGYLLSVDADCMARGGTLSDKIGAGTTIIIGYFDSPFALETEYFQSLHHTKKHFRIYAYEHAEADLVGYDATLQGGYLQQK